MKYIVSLLLILYVDCWPSAVEGMLDLGRWQTDGVQQQLELVKECIDASQQFICLSS